MVQKILSILMKIIIGIISFYLIVGFMIIPLVLLWAIPSQGTKFLKTPVHIKEVWLNPIVLQLTMKGLDVQDSQNQTLLGFDQLFVKVSPIDLFKKIYHVQDFELDGLQVNVKLLSGNQINLMALVPPVPITPKTEAKPSQTIPKQNNPAQLEALPVVIIDTIDLHQGVIRLTDQTIKPNFSTSISAIELNITHITTDPKDEAKVKFHANLDEKGRISMETIIRPLAQPLDVETTFSLNDYALGVLTPYVGKYTGHELKDGKLDLSLDYRIGDNQLRANHKLTIQRFQFGKPVESKDALHLPFGLALALLEDPDGKIKIALPASGNMKDPKFEYFHLIGQVVRNFFLNLISKPFSFIASALGGSDSGTDELGYVRFAPGKAGLSGSQKQKLLTLIKGLEQHPKLQLEIDGSYDPQADWKAIQADIFSKDYEALRKTSSRSESKVYQLLYQRRFGIRSLWALSKKFKKGIGEYTDEKLDQEIKRQLIANAPPDENALSILAQARAQLVHDFLLSNGFDAKRMNLGRPQATQTSMGYVPLQFTLTVFDKG